MCSESFRLPIGELPEALQDQISAATELHTIPLLLDSEFIGSGTLIRFGNCEGILTAAHVIKNDLWAIDGSSSSRQRLVTSVEKEPHELSIETRFLEVEQTEPVSEEYGPDLAFIRVPNGGFKTSILAKKEFWDVSESDDQFRMAMTENENPTMVFGGFPDVYRRDLMPQPGFETVQRLQGHGFLTGQERREHHGGFDYILVAAAYDHGDNPPLTFRGVSGGGLWRLALSRDAAGENYWHQIWLAGVVFYETPLKGGYRHLRAHGPESLYQRFLPQLANRFATRG